MASVLYLMVYLTLTHSLSPPTPTPAIHPPTPSTHPPTPSAYPPTTPTPSTPPPLPPPPSQCAASFQVQVKLIWKSPDSVTVKNDETISILYLMMNVNPHPSLVS